jgi:hypothetical protein
LLEDMGNNPGMGASDVPEGGDVIELGDSVVMGSVVAPVAEGVFGMPHTCDSVVLILVSVGSHVGFASGVVTSDPVDGERWRT